MKRLVNSMRFQLILAVVLLTGLVLSATVQNIESQNQTIAIEVAWRDVQNLRPNAYLLASLSRRILSSDTEEVAQSLIQTTRNTITLANTQLGNINHSETFSSYPEITPLLNSVGQQWKNYISLLETFLDGDDVVRAELIAQIETSAINVSTFTDRIGTAVEEIRAGQTQSSRETTLLYGGIAIIVVIIATIIIFRIALSISHLEQRMQGYATGDFQSRANTQTFSEISAVAQIFNKTADDLNLTIEGLQQQTIALQNARDEALASQRIATEHSRLKSEFLSTMSHELRTPLNAIEGFTSIMLSGMGIDLSPRAEDMVKRISANSKRLLQLINDFLDLSRIEAGRLELAKDRISPEVLVRKWEREVSVLAEEKGLAFTANVSPDLPPTILGDEDALSKIAINLLSNAFKFTHEGQVSLDLQRVNGNWTIAVRDTGIGIPPHAREYIFDEFRQVDGSSKRMYGGTGLGLALVQKLARAMGGNVSLQSEVNEGSTFTVNLPLEIAEEIQQGAKS